MDPIQLTLLIVIVVLAILLVFLGIQVFLILREVRKTLLKTNGIVDNVFSISEHIRDSVASLTSIGVGAGSIMAAVKLAKKFFGRDKDEEEEE